PLRYSIRILSNSYKIHRYIFKDGRNIFGNGNLYGLAGACTLLKDDSSHIGEIFYSKLFQGQRMNRIKDYSINLLSRNDLAKSRIENIFQRLNGCKGFSLFG